MRKTKIICTIGPASQSEEVLTKMCLAGMNVARLNFSHGDHAEQLAKLNTIKKVREALNLPIAIMLDTKGPEFRIKTFEGGKITLADGDPFTFTARDVKGNQQEVSVSYPGLVRDLVPGDTILLNNGLLSFRVEEIQGKDIRCTTLIGGVLSDRKSMSFPGKMLSQPYLSEQDKKDILFGIANEVDYIACSFVSCAKDLEAVHEFLRANGGDDIALIAKIENQPGVDNIEEICSKCEGIMIGRGDMGVEIPFEELPAIQKQLITKCRMMGKRVITATEMLESMIYNPRPTRAEISDVANAVYDGTSAIMLSGESAMGKYPVEAVATMAKIAERTEQSIDFRSRFHSNQFEIHNIIDAISHATCGMAIDINAKAIVACSLSGGTVRLVSRFRPPMDILGITTNKKTWRKLALSWGVTPVLSEEFTSMDVLFYHAKRAAIESGLVKKGDRIVITGGNPNGKSGNSNVINIEQI